MAGPDIYNNTVKSVNYVCEQFQQQEDFGNNASDSYQLTTLDNSCNIPNSHDTSLTSSSGYDDVSNSRYSGDTSHQQDPLNTAMATCGLPVNRQMLSRQTHAMSLQEPTSGCRGDVRATSGSTSSEAVPAPVLDADRGSGYDNVMVWLNQQSCGGTVKRKRRINRRQRIAANMRERRRMTSMNGAFEALRETIPMLPFEKKLSRIQTLRLAMEYINFMTEILHGPDHPSLAGAKEDGHQKQNPVGRQEFKSQSPSLELMQQAPSMPQSFESESYWQEIQPNNVDFL